MTNEKLNILVVEDKPIHQESARAQLNEHNLVVAPDYCSAISSLKERKPQILLTDMMFPMGDGEESNPIRHLGREALYSEQPLGYAVALYAARPIIAVPRIAILTDATHHSNPVCATFDQFDIGFKVDPNEPTVKTQTKIRPLFKINNSLFTMLDSRDLRCEDGPKNWKVALDVLLGRFIPETYNISSNCLRPSQRRSVQEEIGESND